MTWFVYALLCAFSEALKDLTSKRGLRQLDVLSVTWVFFGMAAVLCAPLLWFEPMPTLGPHFWWALLAHGILYGSSVFLYMRAISLSELSVTVPLIMFTPVFMLLTAPIALNEWPSPLGILGILCIVAGSYLLNVRSIRNGLFEPFTALFAEPGARLMLFVAFIWSITSVIDKIGIQNSAPLFWGVCLHTFVTSYLTALLLLKKRNPIAIVANNWRYLLPVGLFSTGQVVGYVYAMQLGLAVYVLAIKRLSVLLVVVFGAIFFGETRLLERGIAVCVMLLGIILISLG